MTPFAVQGIHQRGPDRLGHAVQLQQRRPDAVVPGRLLGGSEVLGEGDHPKAMRAPMGPALPGEDHPDRRGEQAGDRRPVADRGVDPAAGAEPGSEHDGGTGDERAHHRVVLRVGVEQRQCDEEAVLGDEPETGRHRLAREHVVGVGDAHALRAGGRPRRVHHGKVAECAAATSRRLGGLTLAVMAGLPSHCHTSPPRPATSRAARTVSRPSQSVTDSAAPTCPRMYSSSATELATLVGTITAPRRAHPNQ